MQSTRHSLDFRICSFCLSLNRRTTPVLKLSESLLNLTSFNTYSENTQLCWECKARLRSYSEFCDRAERAQVALNHMTTQESLECNSLSGLVTSTTHVISTASQNPDINDKIYSDYTEFVHVAETVKSETVSLKEESDVLADCETWVEVGDKCSESEFYNNCEEPKVDVKVSLKEDNEFFAKHAEHNEDKVDSKCLSTHTRIKNKTQLNGAKTKKRRSYVKTSVNARCSRNVETNFDQSLYEKFIATEDEMREYLKPVCFENKCKICLGEFKTHDNYMKHMNKYHSDCVGEHKCDVCGFGQPTESALKQHRQQHYVAYRCLADGCHFVHKFQPSLIGHQKYKNTRNDAGTHECHHCKKKFNKRSYFLTHMKRVHVGATKCMHCSKDFADGKSLDQHVKLLHPDKMLMCDICGCKYLSQRHLRNHRRRSHLNVAQKKYECSTCNKSFPDRFKERLHQSVHNGMPRIRCHLCKMEFISEKSRIQHLERRHNVFISSEAAKDSASGANDSESRSEYQPRRRRNKNGPMLVCDICGKEFKFPSILKNHLRKHSHERPYKCDICNKSFKHSANLYTHKVIHTGEKPYTCDICSAGFALKCTLKDHVKIHSNEKPFDCNVCGKKFLSNSNLKKHSRIHERLL